VNLLSNAVKFTEKGHVLLTVDAEPVGENRVCLHFALSDTGIGIAPDRMDRLFQSFRQVDASTTRTYGGTGLGLAISRRLVEAMGGDMSAESEPGVGSTFRFTVTAPVAGPPGPARRRQRHQPQDPRTSAPVMGHGQRGDGQPDGRPRVAGGR
jgi:signal transduction histidine kinase